MTPLRGGAYFRSPILGASDCLLIHKRVRKFGTSLKGTCVYQSPKPQNLTGKFDRKLVGAKQAHANRHARHGRVYAFKQIRDRCHRRNKTHLRVTERRRHNTRRGARSKGHLGRSAVPGGGAYHERRARIVFPQLTVCPIRGVAVQSDATTAGDSHEVVRGAKRVVPPLVVRGRVARKRVGD